MQETVNLVESESQEDITKTVAESIVEKVESPKEIDVQRVELELPAINIVEPQVAAPIENRVEEPITQQVIDAEPPVAQAQSALVVDDEVFVTMQPKVQSNNETAIIVEQSVEVPVMDQASESPIEQSTLIQEIDSTDTAESQEPELVQMSETLLDPSAIDTEEVHVPQTSIKISEQITEHLDISEEQQEQVLVLSETLPETVQEAVTEFIETAEPEEAKRVEKLVVAMADIANQLHELVQSEEFDGEQAEILEVEIIEMYEQLLSELSIELDEEQKVELVTQIKSGYFKVLAQKHSAQKINDDMHERKKTDLSFTIVQDTIHAWLGKFVVGKTRQLVPYQADAV